MMATTKPVKSFLITEEQHLRNLSWVTQVGSIDTVELFAVMRNNHRRLISMSGKSSLPFEVYRQWVAQDACDDMDDAEHRRNAAIYSALLTEMLQEQGLWL